MLLLTETGRITASTGYCPTLSVSLPMPPHKEYTATEHHQTERIELSKSCSTQDANQCVHPCPGIDVRNSKQDGATGKLPLP